MDPTTGASTCALGSHRWPKKIGILIKKANIILKENMTLKLFIFNLKYICLKIKIFLICILFKIESSNGIEALTV